MYIDIEENIERYIELVNSINRVNFKKDEFIKMIRSSDFTVAPASTKYHNDMAGGLCDHCLKVYDNLVKLAEMKNFVPADEDSLKIVALFHDLGKINSYKIGYHNKKLYCTEEEYKANPSEFRQHDELGNFKWVSVPAYERVSDDEKLIYGNHEETCEYIARSYIPLRREESIAILHHMGSFSYDSKNAFGDLSTTYRKYPLALLLFEADFMSSILDERIE